MAAWIQGERKRLGLSTKQLSERLALIGITVGEQTISVWESYAGRNPSPENIDALERLFGSRAPDQADAPDADLAAAIRLLVDELRASREERELVEIRLRTLEALAQVQAGLADEALPARSVPREIVG